MFFSPIHAQKNIGNLFVKNEDRGDRMFLDLYYEQAVIYYKMAVKNKDNNNLVKLKLANTYRLLRDYESAVEWYGLVLESDSQNIKPINKYYYADALLSTGQPEEAKKWYTEYQSDAGGDSRIARKILGIDNLNLLKRDSVIVEIRSLPFNSKYSDFGSTMYKGGLVFSSARGKNTFIDPDHLREEDLFDIYHVAFDSTIGWSSPKSFDKVLNTPYHEGPVAFYHGEDKLILTRSNRLKNRTKVGSDGETKLQLYLAQKTGSLWSNIQPLALNNAEYSIAHPTLNETNDTLFFSSDMPGGYGGNDIYMSTLESGQWANITNLGDKINTEGDEMYPYFTQDRLFFTSSGHPGIGGLDIYKAFFVKGAATKIVSLGYPINSNADDFGFSIDPETMEGYFSSNRAGGKGKDDIYNFSVNSHVLSGLAIRAQDKSALPGVTIHLKENGQLIAKTTTDSLGGFHFYVPFSTDLEIEAYTDEHTLDANITFTTKGNRLDVDSVLIEMRFHDLFAKGLVYDQQTQRVMHDVQVVLHNLTDNEYDTMLTGTDGLYRFPIEPRKEFMLYASKYHFIPDSLDFTSFGIEKGDILNDMILDEEYVDKEIVYFDFDKYSLRSDSKPILDKVVKIMKEFHADFLIIGAHADARGTLEYNQKLSDNRANTTLQYFLDRGIERSRIIARGFGEGFIINRCIDGAHCVEEDHTLNRRAELTVEAELPEEELEDNRN